MRVVLDTNILVSALRATLRKPAIAARIKPYNTGRLVSELKKLAENVSPLPPVQHSPDPPDEPLPALVRHRATWMISASDFASLFAA